MADLLPPAYAPSFMLIVKIIQGPTFEKPYTSEIGAKNDLQRIFHGAPEDGIWIQERFYPPHRVEYAEIKPIEIK